MWVRRWTRERTADLVTISSFGSIRNARISGVTTESRDGRRMTASEAHSTGAIADSRVHVVYENGTEVYVNRGTSGAWTVCDHRGNAVELPVSGWLVFNPASGFYEVSANVSGRRIDHVVSSGYEFLDGRGQWTRRGRLGAVGSVALRSMGPGALELIDIYGNDRIAVQAKAGGSLVAYDADGQSLGKTAVTTPEAGWVEFRPVEKGRRYVYSE